MQGKNEIYVDFVGWIWYNGGMNENREQLEFMPLSRDDIHDHYRRCVVIVIWDEMFLDTKDMEARFVRTFE